MENNTIDFGKKYRIGNFEVLKYTKTLSKRELHTLREDIPIDIKKHLQRGGVPYIRVSAVSGMWSVEFCINTVMFRLVETWTASDDQSLKTSLSFMFSMMLTDTIVLGDEEYTSGKAALWKAYLDRMKAANVGKEDDNKIVSELQTESEALAAIVEMGEELKKEESNGGEQQDN